MRSTLMQAQWVLVQCCCKTTHKSKPHTIGCMKNGRKKSHAFLSMSGNTHKRHGVSTGKPVALVGGKMD